MNRASSEMLHSSATDVTVLERLRARMKWRRQRHGGYYGSLSSVLMMKENRVEGFEDLMASGWPELGKHHEMDGVGFQSSGLVMSRSSPAPVKSRETMASVHMSSFKKRKANKEEKTKVVAEKAESKEKRVKLREEEEEESKIITEQNSTKSKETFTDTSKLASFKVQKTDYIHVRARRGQATDSHSLAERARREKISERMKYLQSLVPGCNKIVGKAGMLDEIINYVQSLQQQVEFLSMKLAAVNPRLDELFLKQENQQGFPANEVSSEMTNSSFVDRLTMDESMVSCCLSSVPETLTIDSASFTEEFQPYSTWDVDLQSIYNVNFEEGPFSNFQ